MMQLSTHLILLTRTNIITNPVVPFTNLWALGENPNI